MESRACKICGETFTLKPKGHARLYCSKRCSRKQEYNKRRATRRAMAPMRWCVWCGKQIDRYKGSGYCSDGCKREASSAYNREYYARQTPEQREIARVKYQEWYSKSGARVKALAKYNSMTPEERECYLAKQRARQGTDEHRAKVRARSKAKYMSNLHTWLSRRVGTSVRDSLANRIKHHKWEHLLGWTTDELRAHLESQFEPWMNWSNHGEWHIDHIIPIAAFNYESPYDIDFKRCWALSNLRPLEAGANQRKGTKMESAYQPALAMG